MNNRSKYPGHVAANKAYNAMQSLYANCLLKVDHNDIFDRNYCIDPGHLLSIKLLMFKLSRP